MAKTIPVIALATQAQAAIAAHLPTFWDAQITRSDAQKVWNNAEDAALGVRDKILLALAAVAAEKEFTVEDVETGAMEAAREFVKTKNTKMAENSLSTFMGHVKRAMHPAACEHVPAFYKLADAAWKKEAKLDDKSLRHVQNNYARKYHAVQGLCADAIAGDVHTTVDEFRDAAKAQRAAKVAKRVFTPADPDEAVTMLKDLAKKLANIQKVYDSPQIDGLVKYVAGISAAKLAKAKRASAAPKPETADDVAAAVDATTDILADTDDDLC